MRRYFTTGMAAAVLCLVLAGCGGGSDNGGLSPGDMASLPSAEPEPELPAMEPDELQEQVEAPDPEADTPDLDDMQDQVEAADPEADTPDPDDVQEQVEAADPEADGSDLDATIAALQEQINVLIDRTQEPSTPLEILGGTAGVTRSANDRAALAATIAGQWNARYDHDGDGAIVNLPEIPGDDDQRERYVKDMRTRDVTHAAGNRIFDEGGFLKHAFKSGTVVDLTSPGDVETLKARSLGKVDGVELMRFSLRETDKVLPPEAGRLVQNTTTSLWTFDATVTSGDPATQTTTLGIDGSKFEVAAEDATGQVRFMRTTTYVGGNRIEEIPTNVQLELPSPERNVEYRDFVARLTLGSNNAQAVFTQSRAGRPDFYRNPMTYDGAIDTAGGSSAGLASILDDGPDFIN